MFDEYRVIGAVCPSIPIFAVFYDENDDIFTHDILWFEIQEDEDCVEYYPVICEGNTAPMAVNLVQNFVGISKESNPKKEDFESVINSKKKRKINDERFIKVFR